MSQRERALSALHRLREFQHGKHELTHRLARLEEKSMQRALQTASADLAHGVQQSGDRMQGVYLDLGRDQAIGHLLQDLHDKANQHRKAHEQAREHTAAAAAQHLTAQRLRDHVAESLAQERARLQQARDMRAYDDSSDLLLSRRLNGSAA